MALKNADKFEFARKRFRKLPLPDWTLTTESIGSGGQATVCVVQHNGGTKGAFRCLQSNSTDEDVKRFDREVAILKSIDHPNVMRLLVSSENQGDCWYISELGQNFRDFWDDRRRDLADDPDELVGEAAQWLLGLAEGLAVCHNQGVVHRDIKPANLILRQVGDLDHLALIDFGLASADDGDDLTPSFKAVGNYRFSPDAMQFGHDAIPWFDVFEFAQVLIWMVWADRPQKHNWQRPVHWKYVRYDPQLSPETEIAIRAFTALCSLEETAPRNGTELVATIKHFFQEHSKTPHVPTNDLNSIENAIAVARASDALQQFKKSDVFSVISAAAEATSKQIRDQILTMVDAICRENRKMTVEWQQAPDFESFIVGAKNAQGFGHESPILLGTLGHVDARAVVNIRIIAIAWNPILDQPELGPVAPGNAWPIGFVIQRYADSPANGHQGGLFIVTQSRSGQLLMWAEGGRQLIRETNIEDIAEEFRKTLTDSNLWRILAAEFRLSQ